MDPKDRDREVEQWIEAALGQFGKVEPRTGLEGRVLATLQGERDRIASQRRWWRAAATIAVAAIVVAVWLGNFWTRELQTKEVTPSTMRPSEETGASHQIPRQLASHSANEVRPHRPKKSANRTVSGSKAPKLEQFPSPQPLSEQEKILASYVMNYPEQAALVAQARAEVLRQEREEEAKKAAHDNVP